MTISVLWLLFLVMVIASLAMMFLGYRGAEKLQLYPSFQRLEQAESRLEAVQVELRECRTEKAKALQIIDQAREKRERLQETEKELRQLEGKQRQLLQVNEQLSTRHEELKIVKTDLNKKTRELDQVKVDLPIAEERLKMVKASLTAQNELLTQATTKFKDRSTEISQLDDQLKTTKSQLSQARAEQGSIRVQNQEQEQKLRGLQKEEADTLREVEARKGELLGLQNQIASERAQQKVISGSLRNAKATLVQME
jgi:chromosome segregation ATPase